MIRPALSPAHIRHMKDMNCSKVRTRRIGRRYKSEQSLRKTVTRLKTHCFAATAIVAKLPRNHSVCARLMS